MGDGQEQRSTEPAPLPAALIPEQDRSWAMLAHLSILAGVVLPPIGGPLGPLVVKLTKGKESRAVDVEATEALNFGITLCLAQIAAGLLAGLGFGRFNLLASLPTLVGLAAFVFALMAAMQVRGGRPYRYPYTLRLLPEPAGPPTGPTGV